MSRQRGQPQRQLTLEQVECQVKMARSLLLCSGFKPANDKIASEFERLGLFLYDEQREALASALCEITCDCYAGPYPPNHLSSEPKTAGTRMIGFVWNSPHFGGRRMYFKFCIQKFRGADTLFVFSLHESPRMEGD